MFKTQQLKNLLAHHEALLSHDQFAELTAETERMISLCIDQLGVYKKGSARAQGTHAAIDFQNTQYTHIPTTCKKGCGFCCHLEIEISEDDADRLAEAILQTELQIDEQRLKEQAGRQRLDETWNQGPVPANRCVLLGDDQTCRAYDSRPATCRKHAVMSSVENCATPGAFPIPRLIPMNEIILSASINLPENQFGSLSKMLSKALAKKMNSQSVHRLDFIEGAEELPAEPGPDVTLDSI
jgi:Fe-S-cluster containining protein